MDGPQTSQEDFYVELLRDSRGLSPERSKARDRWFESLSMPDKETTLFELEALLKGLVAFSDTANHPGPRRAEPAVARGRREEVRVVRAACERVGSLCLSLLGEHEEQSLGGRQLLPPLRDSIRGRLVEAPAREDAPETSLRNLKESFDNLGVLADALALQDDVAYPVFMSLERLAGRAIAQSTFFDPLVNLEFRSEFDRIPHVEVLETIYGARPLGARKTVTLAFLSLLRLIRYLDAAGRYLVTPPCSRLVYLLLAAARSDGRALTLFLRRDARQWLAEGFEREVTALNAAGLAQAVPRLRADHRLLKELGSVLHSVGDRLGLELRRTFERALPPVETPKPGGGVESAIESAIVRLGGFIKWCVVAIGQVFDPGLVGPRVFEVYPDEPAELERLRREIWMFAQILRGFLAKAAASHESTERWSASSSHRFVFEFISYYRNSGHYIARRTGYERLARLTEVLEVVAAMEVIQPERLAELVAEAEAFHGFMTKTFEALCAHPLLEENEFDRKDAAHTLRLYLDR